MHPHPIRAALAFAACLAAAPAVLAQEGPPAPPPGPDAPAMERFPAHRHDRDPGPGGPGFLRGLDLSEAQQDRVFAIMHAQVPQRRDLDKAERRAREALREQADGASLDERKASAAAQALGQAIAAHELLRLRTRAQLMAVLTPEQRAGIDARHAGRGRPGGRDETQRKGDSQ